MDEPGFLEAIARGDDASRLVYADWLEQHGHAERAEFLRLQEQIVQPGGRIDGVLARLRELAGSIDPAWRVQIARARVQGCRNEPCGMDWSKLETTDKNGVRKCGRCSQNVYYVTTSVDHEDFIGNGWRVVVDADMKRVPRSAPHVDVVDRGELPSPPPVFRTWNPPMPNPPMPMPQKPDWTHKTCSACQATSSMIATKCGQCGADL